MIWVTSALDAVLTPTAIALGNFDGIHRGHQQVIAPVVAAATTTATGAIHPTVVSFYPHPRAFFSGQTRPLLAPPEEKAQILSTLGVVQLVLLPFDHALASLSPEAFVREILLDRLGARLISVGQDFHFGRDRAGNAALLAQVASAAGVAVQIVPLYQDGGERIASSRIREYLSEGNLLAANRLLGRAYSLRGPVVRGQQVGRTLGFATANLALTAEKFLPRLGVYAVRAELEEGSIIPAVANVGWRPTLGGEPRLSVEVHLLDWTGDLYGQRLTAHLVDFLRPEQRFASLEALSSQIARDCATARDRLGVAVG